MLWFRETVNFGMTICNELRNKVNRRILPGWGSIALSKLPMRPNDRLDDWN